MQLLISDQSKEDKSLNLQDSSFSDLIDQTDFKAFDAIFSVTTKKEAQIPHKSNKK